MVEVSTRDDRTIYIKNLDNKVTEEILFELFLQAGPLVGVKRPKDSEGNVRPFAFVEFEHDVSPPYARSLMDGIRLFGRSISVQFRSGSRHFMGSQGNSPAATPPYNAGSGQSPAPNGYPGFPTPPMVQRSMSAPQGLMGMAPALAGFGMPIPLMGNPPVPGFFPGTRLGMVPLMQQLQFNEPLNGQPLQHLPDRLDDTPNRRPHNQQHHHRHGRSPQEHQRSHQGNEEDQKLRSHHRDSHHQQGHSGGGRRDNRYRGDRGQYSEERRHGGAQRHQSQQQHRHERREHPYRR